MISYVYNMFIAQFTIVHTWTYNVHNFILMNAYDPTLNSKSLVFSPVGGGGGEGGGDKVRGR